MTELSNPLQVWQASDCKAAIVSDLTMRWQLLHDSMISGKHGKHERNALLTACRVLEVAINDIERNVTT